MMIDLKKYRIKIQDIFHPTRKEGMGKSVGRKGIIGINEKKL